MVAAVRTLGMLHSCMFASLLPIKKYYCCLGFFKIFEFRVCMSYTYLKHYLLLLQAIQEIFPF